MAARVESRVNLLPTDRFEYSRIGKFLTWALSTGRHVLMFTELVVILVFLSRFWFDRRLVNLREIRYQKEVTVDSYDTVLTSFLRTQSQLSSIRRILTGGHDVSGFLSQIQSMTPLGIVYDEITVSSQSATIRGFSTSSQIFSSLLTTLQSSSVVKDLVVRTLEISKDRSPGIDFELLLPRMTS